MEGKLAYERWVARTFVSASDAKALSLRPQHALRPADEVS